jgi:hypothetical protein
MAPMSSYYKNKWLRNQIEEGLWKYLSSVSNWGNQNGIPEVPQVFKSRVKKLLNLDRNNGNEKGVWVFYDSIGGGTGTQELYSDFHVFNMAIALNMLSTGFKQSEIIFFLQHIQDALKENYGIIRSGDSIAPICGTNRNCIENAIPVFMLINRVEMQEMWPGSDTNGPIIMAPYFVKGTKDLQKEISTKPNLYTAFIIIEIADAALSLPDILESIPAAKRGRPS